ncbi:MAG: glycosyltransferase family 4 protein [Xanthobacteraceae bacterium]|jgi:glycosyltransferase involved in cell wall biosynthesis
MAEMRAAASMQAAVAPAVSAAVAATPRTAPAPSLKILHILRAPLGGLFRHVVDVASGQSARGHRVGLIVDSTTGGARADAVLAELLPHLALGVQRVAMTRELSPSDIGALRVISQRISLLAPDVLHGHGAKGAALARLAPGAPNAIRVYTPHGGSLVYSPGTIRGAFYRKLEWLLRWRTDLFLFESAYVADLFRAEIGRPRAMVRIVRNGVGETEFAPVTVRDDATDIVCVGELRPVKGIDVLIEALAILRRSGRRVSATIAGEGPQGPELVAQAQRLGVADQIRFVGYQPAREAFAMGRMLVLPSRAESLPYVVLEAAAAGVPIVATRVGGIPEIFGPQAEHLIAPDNVSALVGAIGAAIEDPAQVSRVAQLVKTRVHRVFSSTTMVDGGIAAYREALAMRKLRAVHITNF